MAADLDQLQRRITHLEDLEAIRTTWRDYCIRLDSADWPALADVFTQDAVLEMDGLAAALDGEYRGRDDIIERFYKQAGTGISQGPVGNKAPRFSTGHISTNMQIDLEPGADEATTLAYFFEIVANNLVLIGTYQHRFRREPDRWRFAFLRISVRYRARLEASDVGGQPLTDVLAKPV